MILRVPSVFAFLQIAGSVLNVQNHAHLALYPLLSQTR